MAGPERSWTPEELKTEYKQNLETASVGMLGVIYDAFDCLTSRLPETVDMAEKEQVQNAIDLMQTFVDSTFVVVKPKPRIERTTDRITFLPGQHKGVAVEFVTESGDLGFLNLYGGLRDSDDNLERKDQDLSMRRHHSTRTDRILSQPVHLNIHVKDPLTSKPIVDIWVKYRLNQSFELHKLLIEENKVDLSLQIGSDHPHFADLNQRLLKHSRTLTTFVPSA